MEDRVKKIMEQEHIREIVDGVCIGHIDDITELHYNVLGYIAWVDGLDEGSSILHNLRDIIEDYLSSK